MSTIDKLLDAAEYRMRRGGYNAVSFRDLASDTDIKSSSVHYHFPRKEDLGVALIKRYAERFFDAVENEAVRAKTPEGKLEALRTVYRKALTNDEAICLCSLLGAESAGLPDLLSREIEQFFKNNINWAAEALPENIAKKERDGRGGALVATLQGAMMLATSLSDQKLFDSITRPAISHALR